MEIVSWTKCNKNNDFWTKLERVQEDTLLLPFLCFYEKDENFAKLLLLAPSGALVVIMVYYICFGAQSFVHFSAQTQLRLKKLFMWFQ